MALGFSNINEPLTTRPHMQMPPVLQPTPAPTAPQGFDINSYIQAMLQIAQQQQGGRQQMHRDEQSGRHLGTGGADITPDNPTGNTGNPFNSGFFSSSAAQLSPEARLASQGSNATNQWAAMGQVQGVDAQGLQNLNGMAQNSRSNNIHPTPNYAANAAGASQSYHPMPGAFSMPAPVTGPEGNPMMDQANLGQAQRMYHPGGMLQHPMQPQMPVYWPQQQPKAPGNFGTSGSPGRGFAF